MPGIAGLLLLLVAAVAAGPANAQLFRAPGNELLNPEKAFRISALLQRIG